MLQAAGSSAGLSTGIAIIGDIYKLEERGTAMGITFGVRHSFPPYTHPAARMLKIFHPQALLIGPAVAPLTGGIVTEYV